jgi:hypothetical protein
LQHFFREKKSMMQERGRVAAPHSECRGQSLDWPLAFRCPRDRPLQRPQTTAPELYSGKFPLFRKTARAPTGSQNHAETLAILLAVDYVNRANLAAIIIGR